MAPQSSPVYLVGVAGGSGSGKTYFARDLQRRLGADRCGLIFQDNYYIDQSARFDHDGGAVNFDHPDALDFPLLASQLAMLKAGTPIDIPIYDFATHTRRAETLHQDPVRIVMVDGILIFHPPAVRALFDELIFFDTPEELRYQRRLERDVHERGRTAEGVRAQFLRHVKPMHDQFVEPSKAFADKIVSDLGEYSHILEQYVGRYQKL